MANMRKSGLQNAEDELSRYINKNGEKGVISSVPLTASGSSSSSLATSGAKAVPVQSGTSSSGVNPIYQGNDFLQWYKKNFGTDYDTVANEGWSRPEGMADVDYEIGANLYNSYLSKRLLEDTYGSTKNELMGQYNDSLAALDTNKNTAMQQADVLRSRVEKYLPTQLKAQGLGGLGIGQQMQLDAYNDYVSDIGKINSEYNTNRTDLDSSHNSALAELEREYLENKTNLSVAAGEQSQNIFDKYLADYEAEQDELYAEAVNTILNSSYTTEEEMQAYIDKFRGKLSSENIASLQQYANGIAATNAENEQRELYDSALSAVMNSGYTTEQEILSFIDQFKGILSEKNISILKQYAKGLASQNLKAQQKDLHDTAISYMKDWIGGDIDALENYISTFEGRVNDWQWDNIQQYLEDMKSSDDFKDYEEAKEEEKKEQEALDNYYKLDQNDVTFNNNGKFLFFGAADFREGDNFSVIDSEGRKYRIESGGEEKDAKVIRAAINVANNTVFGCAEKLYIKKDGHIYEIQNRELGTKTKDYEDLYKRIFG